MSARLERALGNAGLDTGDLEAVLLAHDRAGAFRALHLPPDEDDPRWLHPGRNVLVLLEDAGVADPAWLVRVAGLDQGRPWLIEPAARAALVAAGVPVEEGATPDPDWLAKVVELPDDGVSAVLSDALDHLRHLHLDPPGPGRSAWARAAREVLLPLAGRGGARLERRFRWWCARVAPGLAASPDFDSS